MNLFSFIKERIAILDLVNEYVTLKKAGGYYKGTCPFHHEKTASFTVSPDKQIFYCFGCHVSGDAISFIAKIENCSQKEAAQFLADKYNINLPQIISFEPTEKHTEQKNQYFAVCKAVALWCHEQLLKNPLAQSYFYKRGFTKENFDYFTLGYFPGGYAGINDLLSAMKKQSILSQDLIQANIIAPGKTNHYSPFEERLIFPIKDSIGRYCAFGGRIFKDHDTRPKYYNSRENEFFIKGSILFNLDLAKKNIQETGKIFLVEGYTDCMAMIQHNIPNTVATLGTACTIEHLKQLARYCQYLYIVYDNDNAGQQAILRLAEMCWQVNLELKVLTLPPGEDPASFLHKNNDMQSLINAAQDIFLFFLNSLGADFITKPLTHKIQITRSFLNVIVNINDPLKRDILLQKAALIFDIAVESLKKELQRIEGEQPNNDDSASNIAPLKTKPDNTASMLEKKIFCAIMNNVTLLNGESRQRHITYLSSPLREIIIKLKNLKEKHSTITFSYFFETLDNQEKEYVSMLLLDENEAINELIFDKLLIQLQKKQWKATVREIKVQLIQAKKEGDTKKVSLILHDFIELQSKILH